MRNAPIAGPRVNPRAEHRTVYGIWLYAYSANTVTGTPVTVTIQQPENP